jgi:hypothetical protein
MEESMRAWSYSCVLGLLFAVGCGGDTAVDLDGGDDGSTTPDTAAVDTGTGNDSGTVDDTGTTADTGSDGTTTIDAGPFDPTQLGNLVLWLDAAKGVTQNNNAVSAWADQTTFHNDASGGMGNGSHQPTIAATVINGLPAVHFSGSFQQPQYFVIADSASLEFGAGDFAVFMVAQYTNPTTGNFPSQGTFYNKVAGNNTPTGPQLYGNAPGPNNTTTGNVRALLTTAINVNSAAATYDDGKPHRIGIRRTGNTLEVWTDGVNASLTPDAGTSPDVSAVGSNVYIGARPGGNNVAGLLAGDIAEVIGMKGTVSASDVTNVDGYFKTKYAL